MQYFLPNFHQKLKAQVAKLLNVDEGRVNLTEAKPEIGADVAIPCFNLAKELKRNPAEIAAEMAGKLKLDELERIEAAGGYLNIWLKPAALAAGVAHDFTKQKPYGSYTQTNPKLVISEFPSPNMAKPYSVGHLRPALQGWAVMKLMLAMGYRVVSDNHLGDYGTPFGKWVVGFKSYSDEKALEEKGVYELARVYIKITEELKKEAEAGEHKLADAVQEWLLKLENGDTEAREFNERFKKISLDHMHAVMGRLKIKTDEELGEAFYVADGQKMVDELIDRGIAEQGDDGSVVIRLDAKGIDTPVLVRKSNGAALYATSDLATLRYRVERWHPAKVIYHTGGEQAFYFRQLFAIADLLGYGDVEWVHVWHGMIDQITDEGTREKMSSRRGVVLMEELLDKAEEKATDLVQDKGAWNHDNIRKVALGAIKFNDFTREIRTKVLFDWETIFSLRGKSGPYVQYAAVRISSILAKLDSEKDGPPRSDKVSPAEKNTEDHPSYDEERELLRYIAKYPLVVREAAESYEAHKVATFLYELAQAWNRYYESTPILKSEPGMRAARLEILKQVYAVYEHGLDVLGIEIPSKM